MPGPAELPGGRPALCRLSASLRPGWEGRAGRSCRADAQ